MASASRESPLPDGPLFQARRVGLHLSLIIRGDLSSDIQAMLRFRQQPEAHLRSLRSMRRFAFCVCPGGRTGCGNVALLGDPVEHRDELEQVRRVLEAVEREPRPAVDLAVVDVNAVESR